MCIHLYVYMPTRVNARMRTLKHALLADDLFLQTHTTKKHEQIHVYVFICVRVCGTSLKKTPKNTEDVYMRERV